MVKGEKSHLLDFKDNQSTGSTYMAEPVETNMAEPEEKPKSEYPKGVWFIVGNEFCERFSYYGMRAILVIYLTDWLGFGDNLATAVYHTFVVICYVMPLFGGMIADGWLGKFKTVLYLSIVYAFGNVIMSMTAFPPPYWLGPLVGLLLIGVGTGGIKPCVSSFGGDQFAPNQERELNKFFSIFYFAINMGSLLSMIITPLLREYVHCFGHSCYSLAFGIPAVLMILSLILFVAGKSLYKIVPSKGNVVGEMFKCTGRALKNKCCGVTGAREHWLDHADDKYPQSLLDDVKLVYRVLALFLSLPIFWALFDQQGSRWTLQAIEMDRKVGQWQVPPDLMQSLNPVFIVTFIPLFETLLYPGLKKCGFDFKLLQRMVIGMFLAACAFLCAGFLQLKIQGVESDSVSSGQSAVRLINGSPCPVVVTSSILDPSIDLSPAEMSQIYTVDSNKASYTAQFDATGCDIVAAQPITTLVMKMESEKSYHAVVSSQNGQLEAKLFQYETTRPKESGGLLSLVYTSDIPLYNSTVSLVGAHKSYDFNVKVFEATEFKEVATDKFEVYASPDDSSTPLQDTLEVKNGGIYTLVILPNASQPDQLEMVHLTEVKPNSVSILYQIPQYIIITSGEILFSISGLSFAYAQAPKSMKSVVSAGWLMTVAGGNIIDVIIAGGGFIANQAVEFFVFAILMVAMTVVFGIQSYFYKYVYLNGYSNLDDDTQVLDEDDRDMELASEEPDNNLAGPTEAGGDDKF